MKNIEQYLSEFEVCATDAIPPLTTQGNINTTTMRSKKHKQLNTCSRENKKSLTLKLKAERRRKYAINE